VAFAADRDRGRSIAVYPTAGLVEIGQTNQSSEDLTMTDEHFIAGFEDCSLAAETFDHRAHVRMAYLYLCRYPILEAVERFSSALARFATAKGKPGRYHETVTWAFLFLIRERLVRAGGNQTWEKFAESNPDLMSWDKSILKHYYRDDTLRSDLAKRIFLLPDRLGL